MSESDDEEDEGNDDKGDNDCGMTAILASAGFP